MLLHKLITDSELNGFPFSEIIFSMLGFIAVELGYLSNQ